MIPAIEQMTGAFDLKGKTAVITGGNGGIGLGIAKAMAQAGANVAIFCRDMKKAEGALSELNGYGGKHQSFSCDVLDPDSVNAAVSDACNMFGNIDILVNNSGVGNNYKLLDMDHDISQWRTVIDTNLTGTVQMTYEVGKRMRDAGKGGVIINNTSNSAFMVNKMPPISAYAVAKAGANHFTRCMAVELAEYDIRVNAIAPGWTRAGMGDNMPPELFQHIIGQQAHKRLAEALEVGALAVFLASPAAVHITGSVILIDGGYTLSC